ncbi:MAG: PIN domain-containing protein [Nevskiaceae bacterium]|nr:PIN domain-containing protein [Nevskiaceae bacterium]
MTGVLVDTSVWVDHFRQQNASLRDLLERDLVLTHPFVLGEIACGTPPNRARTLSDLTHLRSVQQASLQETMEFIGREKLFGLGCGLIDLTLLASTLMTSGATLWTQDKRLSALTTRFGVHHRAALH